MRYLVVLIFGILPGLCLAQDWEDQRAFGDPGAETTLRIISSTDTSFFEPILASFVAENPGVAIEYLVTGTAALDGLFRADPEKFDLVISSAMDLQLKLANDGFALRIGGVAHPDWAEWRQSLFAFTTEPAAIVINRAAFNGLEIPRTRQDLIHALRDEPERFHGKLGTYDVRQSGLGYLFATQDARASETYWRLMEVMGGLETRLYCCSGEMIDDLASGEIVVAYNVLGSYAAARKDTEDTLEIVLPSEFPTTMMRTALVSNEAPNADAAIAFMRHLIGVQTRRGVDHPLPPLDVAKDSAGRSTIALEPALMTYLDTLKRRRFLQEWESAIIQQR
ncbi:MAG: ABC transporter substrate-binding protein [Silicimonas sp.]|nr:ABC transporter substrate-binding protein [Silicimonas sp.]